MKIIPVSHGLAEAHQALIAEVKKTMTSEESLKVNKRDSLPKYFEWLDALIRRTGLDVTTHAMHQYHSPPFSKFFVLIHDPNVAQPYYGKGRYAEFCVTVNRVAPPGLSPFERCKLEPKTVIQHGFRCGNGNEPPQDNFHVKIQEKRFLRTSEIDRYLADFLQKTNQTLRSWFSQFDKKDRRNIVVLETGETLATAKAIA